MKLRYVLLLTLAVGLAACSDSTAATSSGGLTLPPPTPDIVTASSVVANGEVNVTVLVLNRAGVHLEMVGPPQCSVGVSFFPDPSGQPMTMGSPSTGTCMSAASTFDLAPGDSVWLSRSVPASDLARYAPGTYGVNATVATTTVVETVWAGAVKLPPS